MKASLLHSVPVEKGGIPSFKVTAGQIGKGLYVCVPPGLQTQMWPINTLCAPDLSGWLGSMHVIHSWSLVLVSRICWNMRKEGPSSQSSCWTGLIEMQDDGYFQR